MDAVIVLANLMSSRAVLNKESRQRLELAAELFFQTRASCIVTSGWAYRSDCPVPIAEAMKRHLLKSYKLRAANVLDECTARDTVGDAVFTRLNVVEDRKWKNLLIVTSDYHVERTAEIFNFVYAGSVKVSVAGAKTTLAQSRLDSELKSLDAFRRTFQGIEPGNISQIYIRMMQSHPFYNGEVYK